MEALKSDGLELSTVGSLPLWVEDDGARQASWQAETLKSEAEVLESKVGKETRVPGRQDGRCVETLKSEVKVLESKVGKDPADKMAGRWRR